MTSGYFFGKKITGYNSYLLLGVNNFDVMYCGSYNCNENGVETITSINSGETFYSFKEFVVSILGMHSTDEWMECCIYDEEAKQWGEIGYFYVLNDNQE